MDTSHPNPVALARAGGMLARARVVVAHESSLLVQPEGEAERVGCDLLDSGGGAPLLAPGDTVLLWRIDADSRGIVLGRVGPSVATPAPIETPETLVLEATHELTLRVGEGSITIREDGRILIKGKDLVSHAQRMNRIKGGAVSIN